MVKIGLKKQKTKPLTSIDVEHILLILNYAKTHTHVDTPSKFVISIPTIKKWELLYNSKGLKGLLIGINTNLH